jgi:hypothetical protein
MTRVPASCLALDHGECKIVAARDEPARCERPGEKVEGLGAEPRASEGRASRLETRQSAGSAAKLAVYAACSASPTIRDTSRKSPVPTVQASTLGSLPRAS